MIYPTDHTASAMGDSLDSACHDGASTVSADSVLAGSDGEHGRLWVWAQADAAVHHDRGLHLHSGQPSVPAQHSIPKLAGLSAQANLGLACRAEHCACPVSCCTGPECMLGSLHFHAFEHQRIESPVCKADLNPEGMLAVYCNPMECCPGPPMIVAQ